MASQHGSAGDLSSLSASMARAAVTPGAAGDHPEIAPAALSSRKITPAATIIPETEPIVAARPDESLSRRSGIESVSRRSDPESVKSEGSQRGGFLRRLSRTSPGPSAPDHESTRTTSAPVIGKLLGLRSGSTREMTKDGLQSLRASSEPVNDMMRTKKNRSGRASGGSTPKAPRQRDPRNAETQRARSHALAEAQVYALAGAGFSVPTGMCPPRPDY